MQLQMMPLVAFSLYAASCAGIPRPDSNLCLNNVPLLHQVCHNLNTDYDDNGELLPNHPGKVIQYKDEAAMLAALNKTMGTDPQGLANIKAWTRKLRDLRPGDAPSVTEGSPEEQLIVSPR